MKKLLIAIFVLAMLVMPAVALTEIVPTVLTGDLSALRGNTIYTQSPNGLSIWDRTGSKLGFLPFAGGYRVLLYAEDYVVVQGSSADLDFKANVMIYNVRGEPMLPEPVHEAYHLRGNLAILGTGTYRPPGILVGKYGLFDLETGAYRIDKAYEQLHFVEGQDLVQAQNGNQYRLFDLTGQEVTEQYPFHFQSGLEQPVWFQDDLGGLYYPILDQKTGLQGLADQNLQIVVPMIYRSLDPARSGSNIANVLSVQTDSGFGLTDLRGTPLTALNYSSLSAHTDGSVSLHSAQGEEVYRQDPNGVQLLWRLRADDILHGVCGQLMLVEQQAARTYTVFGPNGMVVFGPYRIQEEALEYLTGVSANGEILVLCLRNDATPGIDDYIVVNRKGVTLLRGGKCLFANPGMLNIWRDMKTASNQWDYTDYDGNVLAHVDDTYAADGHESLGYFIHESLADAPVRKTWVNDCNGNNVIAPGAYELIRFLTDEQYQPISTEEVLLAVQKNEKWGLITLPIAVHQPKPSAWALSEVSRAIEDGLVPSGLQSGYARLINRDEFCWLLSALLAQKGLVPATEGVGFADTTDPAVLRCAALGIVDGYADGRFQPQRPITRQEAAKMLFLTAQTLAKSPLEQGSTPEFDDGAQISAWAEQYVAWVFANNVMRGTSEKRFSPLGDYTVEQAILTVLRLRDIAAI